MTILKLSYGKVVISDDTIEGYLSDDYSPSILIHRNRDIIGKGIALPTNIDKAALLVELYTEVIKQYYYSK